MVLIFYKEKFVVKKGSLIRFTRWYLSQFTSNFTKVRKFFSLFFYFKISGSEKKEVKDLNLPTEIKFFSWIRYVSDGNRVQVFDALNRHVIKIDLKNNKEQLNKEIKAQKSVGNSSPKKVHYYEDKGVFVEQWVKLAPTPASISIAHKAFDILKEKFYKTHNVILKEYLTTFSYICDIEPLLHYFNDCNLQSVEITRIHGDLWSGNLFYDKYGSLIIIDWEYTSEGALSHDIWTYFFQFYKVQKKEFNHDYFQHFAQSLSDVYSVDITLKQAQAYHLLHLLERYNLYVQLNMLDKTEELSFFKQQINAVLPVF